MRTQEKATIQRKPTPHVSQKSEASATKANAKSRERAMRAVEAALDKNGLEPVLLEVSALASYTDYLLIVSGRSDRQVQAIGDAIIDAFAELGTKPIGVEGLASGQWALVDFGDVIVHVFHHPVRDFYDLESLWIDATRVPLDIPPEAHVQVDEKY